uniref:ATP synthase F0 subunit 8 n=1 Tax=Hypsiglena affinis TaxID=509062 RepID=A0A7D5D300_9SAUR|nr:ATP synthase F0 subunit 8 [Hypsiglena affinis]
MPQLDTVYIFFTYIWTWFILYLITLKVKTFMIMSSPKKQQQTKLNKPSPTLPWT